MQLLACLVSVDSLLLCITFQPLQNITNLSWQNATKAALEPLDAMSIVFPAAAQSFFSDVVKYWDYRDYFDWGRKSQRKSHERTQRQGVGWMSLVSSSPWPHLTRQGHQQDEAARYQQRSAGGQHPRCYWTAALISNPSKWFQMYQWDFPWGHPGRDGCIASRPCWKCHGDVFFFFFPNADCHYLAMPIAAQPKLEASGDMDLNEFSAPQVQWFVFWLFVGCFWLIFLVQSWIRDLSRITCMKTTFEDVFIPSWTWIRLSDSEESEHDLFRVQEEAEAHTKWSSC